MAAIVTRESLQHMLDAANFERQQHIVGRALVVLFNNQTTGEKAANVTDNHNNIGFTGADARTGSLTAKSYLKNKSLQDWQVAAWLRVGKSGFARICKYHNQLNEAAKMKATAK